MVTIALSGLVGLALGAIAGYRRGRIRGEARALWSTAERLAQHRRELDRIAERYRRAN